MPPVVQDLNARFNSAAASSNLAEAGILIHIWDGTESLRQKWRGCAHHTGDAMTDGDGCLKFGDRLSGSIFGASKPLFFGGAGGVLLRPAFNALLCAYGSDAGTKAGEDTGGCAPPFCDPAIGNGWCDGAPHRPEDLDHMLRWWYYHGSTYNEVVIDAAPLSEQLPQSIEAIYCDRQVHAAFLSEYMVSAADYPLVGFDAGYKDVANSTGPFFLLDAEFAPGEEPRQPLCH